MRSGIIEFEIGKFIQETFFSSIFVWGRGGREAEEGKEVKHQFRKRVLLNSFSLILLDIVD